MNYSTTGGRTMTRRTLLSFIIALLLMGVGTAYAGFAWMDPIFEVNGTTVMVDIGYDLPDGVDPAPLIPETHVILYVPEGVDASLIDSQGARAEVQFVEVRHHRDDDRDQIPLVAEVVAPNTSDGQRYHVRVTLRTDEGQWERRGRSDKPIRVKGWVED